MSLFDGYAEHIIDNDFIVKNVEIELVKLLKEYLDNVPIYVEFPQQIAKTPAIILTVHNIISRQNYTLGNYVGRTSDGDDTYGIYWDLTVTIDVWSMDTQTRDEIISVVSTLLMMKRRTLRNRMGLVDLMVVASQERGFDLTDRIIQYASHQITDIQRQLIQVEMLVQSTYTPILEFGYVKAIIFNIGQWSKTVTIPRTDLWTEQEIDVPYGAGKGEVFDSIAVTMLPMIMRNNNFLRRFKRLAIP